MSKKESKFPYEVEIVPMRFYQELINKIDDYQVTNFIPFRNVAILELIRLGIRFQHDKSNIVTDEVYGNKKYSSYKHLNISYPVPLIEKIDKYKGTKGIATRSGAITELIQIGLQHPI